MKHNTSKVTTLFNKNHISIIKTDTKTNPHCYVGMKIVSRINKPEKPHHEIQKCVSPLGFYYIRDVYKRQHTSHITDLRVFEVILQRKIYTISYPLSENGNRINQDFRPWEVCENDKSMQDHFIYDLKNVIDSILTIVDENKIPIYLSKSDIDNKNNMGIIFLKNFLYEELFGSAQGIRFQTDEEKILSHGFDLKTSFRK